MPRGTERTHKIQCKSSKPAPSHTPGPRPTIRKKNILSGGTERFTDGLHLHSILILSELALRIVPQITKIRSCFEIIIEREADEEEGVCANVTQTMFAERLKLWCWLVRMF